MAIRTYYHILGVSREATLEEIIAAKNALAKVYHPDANMNSGIDTTEYMQEILEAYRVLSNPEKRAQYDKKLGGGSNRVFRTFTMKEIEPEPTEDATSFVTYWATAGKLLDIVSKSTNLIERESKNETFSEKIMKKFGKSPKSEVHFHKKMERLALQAITHISTLKSAEIPMDYWQTESMNWILIHWSQNKQLDYRTLFAQYDAFVNQTKSSAEKLKLRTQNKQFHHQLKKLLTYAL